MTLNKENPPEEEEVKELMDNYGLDEDTAERVKEIMEEEGVDEEDAIELEEAGL